jgi:outer membrane lipoprotein LolB
MRLPGLLLVLVLTGCATIPPGDTTLSPEALASWQFNGRISLTRGEEGWHAGLTWQEQAGQYELDVSGPMGQGAFQLTGDAKGVLLVDARGQSFTARDADALLVHVTGWALPVTGLRYWVRGLPAPAAVDREDRDPQGRLSQLEQSGWTISYGHYHALDGGALPAKLHLVREDISVRLVIDQWQLEAPSPIQLP